MPDTEKHVETLISKAAKAHDAKDAMMFSQAAANAANAIGSLLHFKNQYK
jgi:hypothetical protein